MQSTDFLDKLDDFLRAMKAAPLSEDELAALFRVTVESVFVLAGDADRAVQGFINSL